MQKNTLNLIEDFFNQFDDVIKVEILYDNVTPVQSDVFVKDDFINFLDEKTYSVNGVGSREFHIEIENNEYTIQVSDFSYATSLDI